MQPARILELAEGLLERESLATPVVVRGSALLGRQALEAAVFAIWATHPGLRGRPPMHTQLLCLADIGRDVARQASHTWWALTEACHHHAYEITPPLASIRVLLNDTQQVITQLPSAEQP